MILVLIEVSTGTELDRVTLSRRQITYATEAARELVESKIERYGRDRAVGILKSWSNGYVSTSAILD